MEKNVSIEMLTALKSNTGLKACEDGTTAGKFSPLKREHFATVESMDSYKRSLCYACIEIGESLKATTDEESSRHRNLALEHVRDAYGIIRATVAPALAPAPVESINLGKKHMRAWIATGSFARLKVNYATGEKAVAMKSWTVLRRLVEMDISDILNARPRLEKVKQNDSTLKALEGIKDRESKRAEKASKPAPAESKPAPAESKPAPAESKPAPAEPAK